MEAVEPAPLGTDIPLECFFKFKSYGLQFGKRVIQAQEVLLQICYSDH